MSRYGAAPPLCLYIDRLTQAVNGMFHQLPWHSTRHAAPARHVSTERQLSRQRHLSRRRRLSRQRHLSHAVAQSRNTSTFTAIPSFTLAVTTQ
jgi:hypothetical protein